MALPDEHDKPVQQNWQSRFAKKRVDLSKSVEEALADSTLAEEILSDELDEENEPVQGEESSMVIPPRLSLQSRPLPAVRGEPKETTSVVVVEARATTSPVEVPEPAQKKKRLAGRTTKVHLQAVPKTEKKSNGKIVVEPGKNEQGPSDGAVAVKNKTKRSGTAEVEGLVEAGVRHTARGTLSGSGVFEQGQKEVSVANAHITTTSVVVVSLVGNPGPVVVKYISLQPQLGFTVHLSASTEARTPFNYVVLMSELF